MLRAILRRLFKIEPTPPPDPWAATTASLRRLMPIAPICLPCRSELTGHSYASLSQAGNKTDMLNLAEALDTRQWETVATIKSFEGSKNAFIAYAIQCPNSTGWILLTFDPVELYENASHLKTHTLTPQEWASLLETFPNLEWHSF